MHISIIAAISDNNVIGKSGGLPWSMPADERYFMQKIQDGYLLTGRKSYESNQGKDMFEGRSFVLITRKEDYPAGPGGHIASSVEEGIEIARQSGAQQLWILGGGEIYRQALDRCDDLYITEIHTHIENGDAWFPEIDPSEWEEEWRERHAADADNPYPYDFVYYRNKP